MLTKPKMWLILCMLPIILRLLQGLQLKLSLCFFPSFMTTSFRFIYFEVLFLMHMYQEIFWWVYPITGWSNTSHHLQYFLLKFILSYININILISSQVVFYFICFSNFLLLTYISVVNVGFLPTANRPCRIVGSLLPPCGDWGSTSVIRLGSKCIYLLSHLLAFKQCSTLPTI